jgi:hypothetical protein
MNNVGSQVGTKVTHQASCSRQEGSSNNQQISNMSNYQAQSAVSGKSCL